MGRFRASRYNRSSLQLGRAPLRRVFASAGVENVPVDLQVLTNSTPGVRQPREWGESVSWTC